MSRVILIAGFGTTAFFASGYAFDDGDFQYWNTEAISWKISDDWKLSLEEEFRYANAAKDVYYQHSDLGFTYSGLAKWLDLGANYRQVYEENKNRWLAENRPHLNATLKWKIDEWSFSNRSRFEYRNREDREDFWRYRNKFTLKTPFKVTGFSIQPYIADEVFYDFDVETVNKNRLFGGFELSLTKNLKADIYYFWESSEKNDDWNDTNTLGTKLTLQF